MATRPARFAQSTHVSESLHQTYFLFSLHFAFSFFTYSLLSPSPHPLRLSVLTGTDCPVGKYSEVGGIPSESQCKDCSAGRYNDVAGWSSPQGCKLCPALTFNKFSGSTSFAACTRCALGFYQDEPGEPACKAASCPRGTWGEILPNCTSNLFNAGSRHELELNGFHS